MKGKWILAAAVTLILVIVFWQSGGIDYLLSRTIFQPDYNEGAAEIGDEEGTAPVAEKGKYSVRELDYKVEVVAESLEIPWEIAFLPDGQILVTERPGRVALVNQGTVTTILEVEHVGEGGLLGMELDPRFEENSLVYLYYTYREGAQLFNRVSRFVFKEDALQDEEVILDRIPGARFHNGGRIRFGPADLLYITTGDALKVDLAQQEDSLAGKILRIHADGSIPEDNPFANSPVFSYGHRNPQGLAWHPVTGQLYSSEHGPTRQDEINMILPGENYGWLMVSCEEGPSQYQDPVVCYTEFTLAPSGMDFLILEEIQEVPLFVAGLRGNMLMRIDFDREGQVLFQEPMFQDWGRLRSVTCHEGSLYMFTNNRDGRGVSGEGDDKIFRVTPHKGSCNEVEGTQDE